MFNNMPINAASAMGRKLTLRRNGRNGWKTDVCVRVKSPSPRQQQDAQGGNKKAVHDWLPQSHLTLTAENISGPSSMRSDDDDSQNCHFSDVI
jgi:hypothetical protein